MILAPLTLLPSVHAVNAIFLLFEVGKLEETSLANKLKGFLMN